MRGFADILPRCVAVESGATDRLAAEFPEGFVSLPDGATDGRLAELKAGRVAAAAALRQLGTTSVAVEVGPAGEPLWPGGFVGSITHKGNFAACAVARADDLAAIGIDAEYNKPVRENAVPRIANEAEIAQIEQLRCTVPAIRWDRLLFSAKESVSKAVAQIGGALAGLDQIAIEYIGDDDKFVGSCSLHLQMTFNGRWTESDGMLFTAVAVEPRD